MARVVVAMSGGVDSSVAAALAKEQGHEVLGVTMTLSPNEEQSAHKGRGCCSVWDVTDAEKVSWKLKIPHYVFNLRNSFEKYVIDDFLTEYRRGRTPNPCRRCNQHIKFDQLLDKAQELGAEYVITGHYAQIEKGKERYHLYRGKDRRKDQSYVLACLTQKQLQHIQFPLGGYTKPEIRQIAEDLSLGISRKKESMDLCFIPDGDTQGFIKRNLDVKPGPILDKEGQVVGQHQGLPLYTIGQRKGLGVHANKPRYVLELSVTNNSLVVGDKEDLLIDSMEIEEMNWLAPPTQDLEALVQYRSTTPPSPAHLTLQQDGTVLCRFKEPQSAMSAGQVAVFYDGDEVLAGGTISKVHT